MKSSDNVFSITQLSISHLVSNINSGDYSLPDLQRPFVWKDSQIRDLFDSLYIGITT
ncbi:DUF262 domain-containing protein [Methanobrevibacter acididurans]|uniref:GmrSD restriction endonuclease domain-containing protein n=1 Tax=Methanobrevibacter acididurans TaxID=120963 RepID=UPI0038FBFA3A